MLGHVSTSVTSQFVVELMTQVPIMMMMRRMMPLMMMMLMMMMMLTKVSGHGGLVRCGQAELDTSVREYERCVRQVQHGLRSAHYMQIFLPRQFYLQMPGLQGLGVCVRLGGGLHLHLHGRGARQVALENNNDNVNSNNDNARCLEAPAVASLQQLQAESLRNSTGLAAECGEEEEVRAVARLAANLRRGHSLGLGTPRSRQVPVSALLRL